MDREKNSPVNIPIMYLVKTPQIIQQLFPNFIWKIPTDEKVLYLTFDDGPIPEVTPWVAEQLEAYQARGTFFCVGDNVRKHPDVFDRLLEGGHEVGNHTFNHLNGWGADNIPYFHNVRRCANEVQSELFRPPYGRLSPRQAQFLQRHYSIVMWDVLSADFDPKISWEQCFLNVTKHAGPGSIVVLHDSLKAESKLREVLPRILEYYASRGYRFEAIDEAALSKLQDLRRSA
jgi:peptidoglycan/xylan/chitin deacetylase (PgdA/CDA1 family)